MTNIHKFADEIFRAPTEDELFERLLSNAPRLTANQANQTPADKGEFSRLFPNGAIKFSDTIEDSFPNEHKILRIFRDKIDKTINWKFVNKSHCFKGKWKDKNILKFVGYRYNLSDQKEYSTDYVLIEAI